MELKNSSEQLKHVNLQLSLVFHYQFNERKAVV